MPMPSSGVWKMMKVAFAPALHLIDQFLLHHDFGDAAGRQTAHEAGAPDVGVVDLEPEAGRQKHAERGDDAQQAAFAVGGLQNDHHEIDVRLVFGGDALQQGALFFGGAGRRLAAHFPIAVLGFDDSLRESRARRSRPTTSAPATAAGRVATERVSHLAAKQRRLAKRWR